MIIINYCDDYKPESVGNWDFAELEHHILQNRRKELNLTQQQVATLAHIQLRQYQRLESGERNMSGASMRIGMSICYALNLDPRRFVPKI